MAYKDPEDLKKYKQEHKEEISEWHKKDRKEHPEKYKEYWQKYGKVNREKHKEEKAGRPRPTECEVCGGTSGGIHFDHDHVTGEFRGWLCGNCNTALGLLKDDTERLHLLAQYLETKAGQLCLS